MASGIEMDSTVGMGKELNREEVDKWDDFFATVSSVLAASRARLS